jgi:SAM-dependent methyltransferase
MQPYTNEFYNAHKESSRRLAEVIVPLVVSLTQPHSVIDIGCGLGTWLSVFKQHGVEDVLGIDGEHIDPSLLEIPREEFLSLDITRPIQISRQFDVVVSLEVAEHLTHSCAESFVESLTKLGPAILFSSAIPHQGGTHHVNEQWPEYWAKYFQTKGYAVIDYIRNKIWSNEKVEYWYAQNTLLFVRMDYLESNARLKREYQNTNPASLSNVHPKYLELIRWIHQLYSLSQEIAALVPAGEPIIVADEGAFGNIFTRSCRVIPFLKCDEQHPEAPSADAAAIQQLEGLRCLGAASIVFAWTAFWWLDYYHGFSQHLRSKFRCIRHNECLIAFDIRSESE